MKEFNSVEEVIEAVRGGKIVVVMDDEDRENEGDVICAAEFATPENVNFMASYAKGLICMPMHVDYVDDNFQSVIPKVPKSQIDTLECTLEELAVLRLIYKNPSIKQKELVAETGKSLSTVK